MKVTKLHFFYILMIACCLVISSCTANFKLLQEEKLSPGPWPYYHGDISAQGVVSQEKFNGQIDIIWEKKLRGKPAGPLTMYDDLIIYPSAKKKIIIIDKYDGKNRGKIKTKGNPQTGMIIGDSLGFWSLSPKKNRIYCYNLQNGKIVWDRYIKDAPGSPILVEKRLFVFSGDGILESSDPETGRVNWSYEAEERFLTPAAYGHGRVYQGGDAGTLFALSPEDGSVLYRTETNDPIAGVAVNDEIIVVAGVTGKITGINPEDGEIIWETELDGPVWSTPAIDRNRIYLSLSSGQIVSLEKMTGKLQWKFEAVEVVKAPPIVVGNYVVAGTLGGNLFVLDASDGQVLNQRKLDSPISVSPISDGDFIYIATESAKLVCLGDTNGTVQQKN